MLCKSAPKNSAASQRQPQLGLSDPGSGGQRCRVSQAPAAQAHLPAAAIWPPADSSFYLEIAAARQGTCALG